MTMVAHVKKFCNMLLDEDSSYVSQVLQTISGLTNDRVCQKSTTKQLVSGCKTNRNVQKSLKAYLFNLKVFAAKKQSTK